MLRGQGKASCITVDTRRYRLAGDHYVPRLGPQPRAFTVGAGLRVQVFRQFFFDHRRIGFAVASFEIGDYAFKGVFLEVRLAALANIGELDLRFA